MAIRCPGCGKFLSAKDKICPNCGTILGEEQSEPIKMEPQNEAEYEVEMARDCRDLIVWRIHTPSRYVEPETAEDDENFKEYFIVELKE